MQALSTTWISVRELQRAAALPISGTLGVANDAALDAAVEGAANDVMLDKSVIKNLVSNRAAKERRRKRLSIAAATVTWTPTLSAPEALDVLRMVDFVRGAVGEADYRMLLALTEDSYEDVASAMGLPVGTVKARASRARARARSAWEDRHVAAA
jgi:hypothetical protein